MLDAGQAKQAWRAPKRQARFATVQAASLKRHPRARLDGGACGMTGVAASKRTIWFALFLKALAFRGIKKPSANPATKHKSIPFSVSSLRSTERPSWPLRRFMMATAVGARKNRILCERRYVYGHLRGIPMESSQPRSGYGWERSGSNCCSPAAGRIPHQDTLCWFQSLVQRNRRRSNISRHSLSGRKATVMRQWREMRSSLRSPHIELL